MLLDYLLKVADKIASAWVRIFFVSILFTILLRTILLRRKQAETAA